MSTKKQPPAGHIANGAGVRWESQGGGVFKKKRGQVRAFVDADQDPVTAAARADAKVRWSRWRGEDPMRERRAASYIVEVPRKGKHRGELAPDYYCVLATVLEQQNPRAPREVARG